MDENDVYTNSSASSPNDIKKPTPKDYAKALAFGLGFSIITGIAIAAAVWYFGSIYVIIMGVINVIAAFIPRTFLRKPHQWLTMLTCALTAFVNPLAIYLTMEMLGVEFEDTYFLFIFMVIIPFAGLYIGYKHYKELQ